MEDVVNAAQARNTMIFPLTPARDSRLFWWYESENAILPAIEQALHEPIEVTNYPIDPKLASRMPDLIRMTRIPRGKIGTGKFADAGIVSAMLGFWENISENLKGAGRYIPRANIDKSKILDRAQGLHQRYYGKPASPTFLQG